MNAKTTSLLLVSSLLFACSSSSSTTTSEGKDASTRTKDSGSGAEDSGVVSCNTLSARGALVTLTDSTATAPTAKGGTIVDGTYALSSYAFYGSMPMGADAGMGGLAVTASISGSTWQIAGTDGQDAGPPTATQKFTATGDTFMLKTTCGEAESMSGTYTATPTEVVLLVNSEGMVAAETFTKQ